MYRNFKKMSNIDHILEWKSKRLSDESIKYPSASNNFLDPSLYYFSTKTRVKFIGIWLKQNQVTFNHKTIVNIYIVYEINKIYNISSYPTLQSCLFGAVSLTKHVDIDDYKYSGYGIGFDRKETFSAGNGFGSNCIIGVGMSSSVYVDNKKKYIFQFLVKVLQQDQMVLN